jgi:hypothetical protein
MDNKKFEQLIELIINENEEQARALFHDIVVEKSRQIYEDLMEEEIEENMEMQGEGNGDEVGGMLDEIETEHTGMNEEEDEFSDIDNEDEIDLDPDAIDGEEGNRTEHEIEDRVVDLEDKLDELMAEFEQMMGHEGGEQGEENDFTDDSAQPGQDDDQDMMESADDEEDEEDEEDDEEETDEDKLDESVQLQKVPTVKHGDNGVNTKSPSLTKPAINGNGASPANLNKGYVDSGKGGTQGGVLNPATKDVKGAGSFKNAPGKNNFSEKGEAAPKPKHGDDGQNKKSVIESRKTTKKIVR